MEAVIKDIFYGNEEQCSKLLEAFKSAWWDIEFGIRESRAVDGNSIPFCVYFVCKNPERDFDLQLSMLHGFTRCWGSYVDNTVPSSYTLSYSDPSKPVETEPRLIRGQDFFEEGDSAIGYLEDINYDEILLLIQKQKERARQDAEHQAKRDAEDLIQLRKLVEQQRIEIERLKNVRRTELYVWRHKDEECWMGRLGVAMAYSKEEALELIKANWGYTKIKPQHPTERDDIEGELTDDKLTVFTYPSGIWLEWEG